jgi:WhiB family redox-sensing transcriptional regulator
MRRENQETINYNWQEDAICKDLPTDIFYPGRGDKVSPIIKERCSSCPVKDDCLEHALKYEAYGYWGGTTERDRVAIRAKRGIMVIKPETVFWYAVTEAKRQQEENRPKIQGRGRKARVCGTYSGYRGHLNKKETPCEPCKKANNEYTSNLKMKKAVANGKFKN